MKKSVIITAIALGFLYSCGCSKSSASVEQPSANFETDPNTFCFYYNWYGLQETDGKIYHWRHNILSMVVHQEISVQSREPETT